MPETVRGFSGDVAGLVARTRMLNGTLSGGLAEPRRFQRLTGPPQTPALSYTRFIPLTRMQQPPIYRGPDEPVVQKGRPKSIEVALPTILEDPPQPPSQPESSQHTPKPSNTFIIKASSQQGRGEDENGRQGAHDGDSPAHPLGNNGEPPVRPPGRFSTHGSPDDEGDGHTPRHLLELGETFWERADAPEIRERDERNLENPRYRSYLKKLASHNNITVGFSHTGSTFSTNNRQTTLMLDHSQGTEGIRTAIQQLTQATFGPEKTIATVGLADEQLHQELELAIMRNGAYTLAQKLGSTGWNEEARQAVGLPVGEHRNVLEIFKEKVAWVRTIREHIDDPALLSSLELEFITHVQEFVGKLPRTEGSSVNPSRVLREQSVTCAEASLIAGTLLREAGIQYAGGKFPSHSFLLARTADGRVYHRDFFFPQADYELSDNHLQGRIDAVTVSDISSFIASQDQDPMKVDLAVSRFTNSAPVPAIGDPRHWMTIYPAETSHLDEILQGVSSVFDRPGTPAELSFAADLGIRLLPEEPNYYLHQANAYAMFGDIPRATDFATTAIELDVDYSSSWITRGIIQARNGNATEAEEDFRKGIELKQNAPEARREFAHFLYNTGRIEEAEEQFQEAVNLDPYNISNRHALAFIQERLGKLDEAMENYDWILWRTPNEPASWLLHGITRLEVGDTDGALADLEIANGFTPENPVITSYRGVAKTRKENFEEALTDLTYSLALQPHNPLFNANIAYYYHETGDYDTEIEALQTAIDNVNPRDKNSLLKLHQRLALASLLVDHDLAFEVATRAQDLAEEIAITRYQDQWFFGEFTILYAHVVNHDGHLEEAESALDRAQDFYQTLTSESPTNPTGFYGQALIHAMRGRLDEARTQRAIAEEKMSELPPIKASAKDLEANFLIAGLDHLLSD